MTPRSAPLVTPDEPETAGSAEYEPPQLRELGLVCDLTLTGGRCWWGKKWGGTDGLEFMGINIPVSSC